jgi:hypothetical protein
VVASKQKIVKKLQKKVKIKIDQNIRGNANGANASVIEAALEGVATGGSS